MHSDSKNVLLIAMPFAGIAIPSIQLSILEGYLKEREINIVTKNLYLKAAEFYGINNYYLLLTRPNESYTAQMVYSKYIFPDHWEKNIDKFKDYFKKINRGNTEFQKNFTFEDYIEKTDEFYHWVINNIDWNNFDIIGFTLNYGQFLPSLAISKKIKQTYPEKKIVFGGSRTYGILGTKALEAFPYVDFIVTGDGEEALHLLASDYQHYETIPNLMYKNGKESIWNESDTVVDLNSLPIPSYDTFYKELGETSEEIQQYFLYYGRLPVEISRGCWWNKCTFCNYSISCANYREKNIKKIVDEIKILSDKYAMLNFQIIGNTLPRKKYRLLFEEIIKIGRDFNFFTEARAGQLKSDDYRLMKEAGFTNIQTGVESFSESYLKKINKGVRVIDNIAALKFCKEYGIKNEYNLIVSFPNEETIDYEETKRNIQLIKQYLDPPRINKLLVGYDSFIFNNPKMFNIKQFDYTDIDKLMFPNDFLEKGFNFYYNVITKEDLGDNNWSELVEEWKKRRTDVEADNLVFYYVDGGNFIKIYDKRNREQTGIYLLDGTERKIFLACVDVISFEELQQLFTHIPDFKLAAILHTFEKKGIVYHEDSHYLSLPFRYSLVTDHLLKKQVPQLLNSDS